MGSISILKITAKKKLFCSEYLIDFNATQAAIRAGYSKNSAASTGCRLLKDEDVQLYLSQIASDRCKRLSLDADYVLQQAKELHERCMQQVQPKKYRNQIVKDEQENIIYEFDATNALKALEMIGKHIDVGAFKESKLLSESEQVARFSLTPITDNVQLKFASTENEIQ